METRGRGDVLRGRWTSYTHGLPIRYWPRELASPREFNGLI